MPLANGLLGQAEIARPEPRFPLVLALCTDCSLVQITETVPPDALFRRYVYFSSFSETMVTHAANIVRRTIRQRGLNTESLVMEIGSNDGYLLQHYRSAKIPVLGIEPARNVAAVAREQRGIPTLCDFFSLRLARRLTRKGTLADVIHVNNVLAHVSDLGGFVSGLREILKPHGTAVIEAPYVKDMIDSVEFDTIYHEHLCYFSLTALQSLMKRNGLMICKVERLKIHGGSLRIFVEHDSSGKRQTGSVCKLLKAEEEWGVNSLEFYQNFGERVKRLKEDLVDLLQRVKSEGHRIAGYGASAKGATLLNYFGIGKGTLDFVVDRSSAKQGWFTPGTHLAILPPEALIDAMPEYALLLTWNFAAEILDQQAEYRRRGGRFILPLPEPCVV